MGRFRMSMAANLGAATAIRSPQEGWIDPSRDPQNMVGRRAAYVARGEARPAYRRAFAAQLAINAAPLPTG